MNTPLSLSATQTRTLAHLAAVAAAWFVSMPALAQLSPALDRVSVSLGAFQTDPKFDVSMNTPYGRLQSGEINMGDDTLGRIKADVILFDSQGLSFDYFQYNRNYTGSIANNANVGGSMLTTTGNANLGLRFDTAQLAYKWWLGSGNTVFGVGLGAAYYKLNVNANATASVGASSAAVNSTYSDDAVAPLLELGVRHAITPNLRLFADASGVQKSENLLNGEIYNAAVGVEWFPLKNVGVVLDYSAGSINVWRDDSTAGNLKIKYQGPSAYLKVRF